MKQIRMINFFLVAVLVIALSNSAFASLASKKWPASDKAKQFVKDTIVIGMMASPYGTGWTKNEQLLEYYRESREAGITGHEMTLAAASQNWDVLMQQHHAFRSAMAEEPENYTFVRTTRDIEAAHIKGKTAVIWNSQTATILEEDLGRMARKTDEMSFSQLRAYVQKVAAEGYDAALEKVYGFNADGLETAWRAAMMGCFFCSR